MPKKIADYLTEDPIITGQKFVCISFLMPSSIVEEKRDKNMTIKGIKVRGSFDTYEDAQERCKYLQEIDPYHNIYIAEVGKWCPFEDDPEKAKNSQYLDKELNKLMKDYKEQQTEAKQHLEARVRVEKEKALETIEIAKKKKIINKTETVPSVSVVEKEHIEKEEEKLDEMKNGLKNNKENLDKQKKDTDESINRLRKMQQELDEKIKEMKNEEKRKKGNKQDGQIEVVNVMNVMEEKPKVSDEETVKPKSE
jgi:hypothetical protein